MKTAWKVWLVAVVGFAGMAGTALAAEKKGNDAKKSPYFVVVKATSVHDEVTFEAIGSSSYFERRKELPKLYKDARQEYDAARKDARTKHERFTEKPPVRPSIIQVGEKFKDEEKAQAFATKLQERWDAIHHKDKGKEDAGATKEKTKEGDAGAH